MGKSPIETLGEKVTTMRHRHHKAGFSLMEINMAVFVMALGILGIVALFPLGLREAVQGRADLKQSMFADHTLNQLVAMLSSTEMEWDDWIDLDHTAWPSTTEGLTQGERGWSKADLPSFITEKLDLRGEWKNGDIQLKDSQYRVFFQLIGGPTENQAVGNSRVRPSSRVMGIGVRSTEKDARDYKSYTNNVLYYAEVMFQGRTPN